MKNRAAIILGVATFFLITTAQAEEQQQKIEGLAMAEAPKQATTETTESEPAQLEPSAPVASGQTAQPEQAAQPESMPNETSQPLPQEQAKPKETVLIDDSIPEGAISEGNWVWDDTLKESGEKSHTEPVGKGLYGHSFKFATPVNVKAGSKIIQYVYLDPQNPPKGIALKFKLKTDEEVGVYWEGPEEAVTNLIGDEELLWYQDELPKAGEWVKLEIPVSEAEIENEDIIGISYLALDGKVNWDRTAIAEGIAEEKSE